AKANLDLQPELLSADQVKEAFEQYAQLEKMATYGKTALASRINEAAEVARAGGTSIGKAKATLDTARDLADADQVREAFKTGDISFDQASEIATAERARPGSSSELLQVASDESFQVLKDKARRVVLEAEQSRGLAERQHQARSPRKYQDRLGMINLHLVLEPHIGRTIVNRAEAEAARLCRKAKKDGYGEPFERHLADAYASLLSGTSGSARPRRPDLVVVVSHEVAARGWNDVRDGDGAEATGAEVCKIPGVGPVSPEVARQIGEDAFLTGVFYDGTDLRHIRRWSRSTPIEVLVALELGDPPPSSTGSSA
ncbi:MAG: 13E12 repeat family protein, partial [Actinomycetota bacterium]|nr:13E12 repeat family protein [Actinomycetota bacterium]